MVMKYAKPSQIFKEYKASQADEFFGKAKFKYFYGKIVELSDKAKENMKLVAEELDLDLESLFRLYEYVGAENSRVLAKVTKGNYQDDLGVFMVKPIIPIVAEELSEVYKLIQIAISVREMGGHPLQKAFSDFVELLTLRHSLLDNLWADYKSIWNKKAPKLFKSNPALYYMAKTRQQIWILMAIFKGCVSGLFKIDDKLFKDMFDTFKEQHFQGSFRIDEPEVTGTSVQREIENSSISIKHLCCLILISALKIQDILSLDPSLLCTEGNTTYAIVTNASEGVFKGLSEFEDQEPTLAQEIAHLFMAFCNVVDAVSVLLSNRKEQSCQVMHRKLLEVVRGITGVSFNSYDKAIESLLHSELYSFFQPQEQDLVKTCIKNLLTLMIVPKQPNSNMLEKSTDGEVEFIAKTVFKLINTPQDLEVFWSKFGQDNIYGNDIPMVFSNFLDMFPSKSELTFNLASHIIGSDRGISYVSQIIELFSCLTKYTMQDDSDNLRNANYQSISDSNSEAEVYKLNQDFEVPRSNGFIIPAGTTFSMTEKKTIKFLFKYNYWNVFWKSLTEVISEGQNKNIALTGSQFKFIKLICKMIKMEPLQAPMIQLMMITPSHEMEALADHRVREERMQGYAGLAMIFYEILALCKNSNDNLGTVLEIIRAFNALMVSDISAELMLVTQVYPLLSRIEGETHDFHVLASIMDMFQTKYFGTTPKPAYLLAELVQLTETIILKSDYLFENFPPQELANIMTRARTEKDEAELTAILSEYLDLQSASYWFEDLTKKFNIRFFEAAVNYRPGSRYIVSNLIGNLLDIVLSQSMDLLTNNSIVDFENCLDVQFSTKARVFSILNNLMSRFKSGSGSQLVINRSEVAGSLSLDFLANYLKTIDLSAYILKTFDVEIYQQDVFFGIQEPSTTGNGLGIENKTYINQVVYSKNPRRTAEVYQTFMVEASRCFETACQLILESVKDTSAHAHRLSFIADLRASMLTVEDFYKNVFNNFSQEYAANFFVMLMVISDFNNEKAVNKLLTHRIHAYEAAITELTNPTLFSSDSTMDYAYMYALKIDQGTILSSRSHQAILKCNSVATAAMHSMYCVLKLWRKANRANKPVLADMLSGGQLSPHFSNQVFTWVRFNHIAT